MFRIVIAVMLAVVVAAVGVWLSTSPTVAQQIASATRSFDKTSVEPGETVTVTITASNYGRLGGVTETLPVGFTYVDSDLDPVQVTVIDARTVRFTLQGDTSFMYTVTASSVEDSHTFSGKLKDSERTDHNVGCPCVVTVEAADQPPEDEPSATRSFDNTTVEPGDNVTVTITAGNYGGAGAVTETLPVGFSYVESSLDSVQVTEIDARTVRFTLQGDTSFMYTVTASSVEDSHTFSGKLRDSDRTDHNVGCPCVVTVEAEEPSATRSFDNTSVEPGDNVTVTITAGNYGGAGAVTETLPVGFTYVESSLDPVQITEIDARTVRFTLQGDNTSFKYTVTASSVEDSHTFSGKLRDSDRTDHNVGCPCVVTVRVSPPPPPPRPVQPQQNRAPVFPGNTATRSVDENSADGANVGARVRASDPDRDTLTYALEGTDASSFSIVSGTGQVTVGTGTMLDYETKDSYAVTVTATDPDNAFDTIAVTIMVGNVEEDGRVTFWRDDQDATAASIMVGDMLTALAEDPDGNVGDTPPITGEDNDMYPNITGATWQWSKSEDMNTWMDIQDATNAAYTVMAADDEYYLRATAMYDDAEGTGKSASEVTMMVGAAAGVWMDYDENRDGMVQKLEYLAALDDFLDEIIERDALLEVLDALIDFLTS